MSTRATEAGAEQYHHRKSRCMKKGVWNVSVTNYCGKRQSQTPPNNRWSDKENNVFAKLRVFLTWQANGSCAAGGHKSSEWAERTRNIYTNKHMVIFKLHRLGAKFYAIAKMCLSVVLNQGLWWQMGVKRIYYRAQSLKIYLPVTRISLKIDWGCWRTDLIIYLSRSMLYITWEFLNSWQELAETFAMDVRFPKHGFYHLKTICKFVGSSPDISNYAYKSGGKGQWISSYPYRIYKEQWFRSVLFLLCFVFVYL